MSPQSALGIGTKPDKTAPMDCCEVLGRQVVLLDAQGLLTPRSSYQSFVDTRSAVLEFSKLSWGRVIKSDDSADSKIA